jgi:hypothetical protein
MSRRTGVNGMEFCKRFRVVYFALRLDTYEAAVSSASLAELWPMGGDWL